MKQLKYLLFSLILLINISIYSQTDSTAIVNPISETERIVDKYSEKISVALQSLAKSLEVPAQRVFEILIKQQYVFAITHTIILLLLIITCIVFTYKCWKDPDGGDWWGLPATLIIGTIIYICFILESIVGCYINPEYYALKEIIQLIN